MCLDQIDGEKNINEVCSSVSAVWAEGLISPLAEADPPMAGVRALPWHGGCGRFPAVWAEGLISPLAEAGPPLAENPLASTKKIFAGAKI